MSRSAARVVYGVTISGSARAFLRGQLSFLASRGWDVHLMVGSEGAEELARREGVGGPHLVRMSRYPSIADVPILVRIALRLRRLAPEVVVMGTPKMGVLGTIAAAVTRVPVRIYLVHGFRAEGLTGGSRILMVALERVACACATHVVAVSPSLRELLIRRRIVRPSRVHVLGSGSANGVDTGRFRSPTPSERADARRRWQVSADALVVTCVGRVTSDKGLQDLPKIWHAVLDQEPDAVLLIAGVPELASPREEEAYGRISSMAGVKLLGRVDEVEELFKASDIAILLSSREGLGMVALEASACGVPTVAYGVTGVVDAIQDNVTGILVAHGNRQELVDAIVSLARDESKRVSMGRIGVGRVESDFKQERVWAMWADFLTEALASYRNSGYMQEGEAR